MAAKMISPKEAFEWANEILGKVDKMAVTPEKKQPSVIIDDGTNKKTIALPSHGEIKIICHDGKVKWIEQTIKEPIQLHTIYAES